MRNMEFGSRRPRPFGLTRNPLNSSTRSIVPNEDRFIRIGHSTRGRILLVVFCERAEGSTIRIISARKATTQEMSAYEKGI
jgi:uncharacterized DUF497 family protein